MRDRGVRNDAEPSSNERTRADDFGTVGEKGLLWKYWNCKGPGSLMALKYKKRTTWLARNQKSFEYHTPLLSSAFSSNCYDWYVCFFLDRGTFFLHTGKNIHLTVERSLLFLS